MGESIYFACENERCRVLVFAWGFTRSLSDCPLCFMEGKRLDNALLDDLMVALAKRCLPPEQEKLPL